MIKILIVIGTRPEAIKMAPVMLALQRRPEAFETRLCLSGQHRELADEVLEFFHIHADFDLDVMLECQGDLTCLTAAVLSKLKPVFEHFRPDLLLVQGDTTTTFAASLAAFYAGVKIGHVEAGLRTGDKHQPFPEEINRVFVSRLADYHFAPTEQARRHLLGESISSERIIVSGNTVLDALIIARNFSLKQPPSFENEAKKILLVTLHRRENQGAIFEGICRTIKQLAKNEDWLIVFPVHPNPALRKVAEGLLGNCPNVQLLESMPYGKFVRLMLDCSLILTDSGGIQEEATMLGKPVLLVRQVTERPEAVADGFVQVVGNEEFTLLKSVQEWMEKMPVWEAGTVESGTYGDGKASEKIVGFLMKTKI